MSDTDVRWNEFEAIGEVQVRKNLADRIYSEEKTLLAREWLAHSESSRNAASNREHNTTARSAKNAAWAAAIAAMIAAAAAMIAAVCAVITVLAHK